MKIEKKELVGYLPYELQIAYFYFGEHICTAPMVASMIGNSFTKEIPINAILTNDADFKPILHPLSDLTKEIKHNGERFVPYKAIEDLFGVENFSVDLTYQVRREDDGLVYISLEKQNEIIQKLHEWHFDLHNWIEKGLAIDINTLNHA